MRSTVVMRRACLHRALSSLVACDAEESKTIYAGVCMLSVVIDGIDEVDEMLLACLLTL
jgi:hypothetical protein